MSVIERCPECYGYGVLDDGGFWFDWEFPFFHLGTLCLKCNGIGMVQVR